MGKVRTHPRPVPVFCSAYPCCVPFDSPPFSVFLGGTHPCPSPRRLRRRQYGVFGIERHAMARICIRQDAVMQVVKTPKKLHLGSCLVPCDMLVSRSSKEANLARSISSTELNSAMLGCCANILWMKCWCKCGGGGVGCGGTAAGEKGRVRESDLGDWVDPVTRIIFGVHRKNSEGESFTAGLVTWWMAECLGGVEGGGGSREVD
ncbi:hypothetical protein Tco_1195172 [Tanacetum coccineum]